MKFPIINIQPNPYRNMDNYPIREDKIEALCESLRITGFWDNVVARINQDGNPEIAYGHHRLAALRKVYSDNHEVRLIIKDLSDDDMAQIMARENMDEWGSNAMVEQETVKAILDGYAEGKLHLPNPHKSAKHLRYSDGDTALTYTSETVAEYVGWYTSNGNPHVGKVKAALRGLDLISEGIAVEDDFSGMSTEAAKATATVVEKIIKRSETSAKAHEAAGRNMIAEDIRKTGKKNAKDAVKIAKDHVESGGGYRDIEMEVRLSGKVPERDIPDINKYATKLINKIDGLFQEGSKLHDDFEEILSYSEHLTPENAAELIRSVSALKERAIEALGHISIEHKPVPMLESVK